jgi:hypothetical protein
MPKEVRWLLVSWQTFMREPPPRIFTPAEHTLGHVLTATNGSLRGALADQIWLEHAVSRAFGYYPDFS